MGRGSVWLPIAGTVCLLGLGGTAWVSHGRTAVRERLARFVAEQGAREASPLRREAVYGETLEGNACDDYVAASKVLTPLRLGWRNAGNTRHLEWTRRGLPLTEEERRALAPSLDLALEHIRRGVRRSTLRFPERRPVATFEVETTVDGAIDRAFATGDGRALAELFVDRWVLTGDLWGAWIHAPEFRDEWLYALDAESAAWFAAGLRRLDERQHCVASPAPWIAQHVRAIADLTPLQQSFEQGLRAWRWGFDSYWRELVACDRLVAALPELVPPAVDWARRQVQVAAFASVVDDVEGGWAVNVPGHLLGHERLLRTALTHLRLLRLAVAFVHRHELPRLDDPLGSGPIEVDMRGDEATFGSEGMNGDKRIERTVRRR